MVNARVVGVVPLVCLFMRRKILGPSDEYNEKVPLVKEY